ncbi:MAG: hypothetical protein KJ821_03935 [Actinobacteria bacterium]|nr:hypothetical protein [Actinomycetota bacterium]MBU4493183.1 hypothetical protein [Nanoarchaeota archaeon]
MNSIGNPDKYRKLPITSLITGILALTIFSAPQVIMWSSRYLITDTQRLIFNFSIGIIIGIILPVVAIVFGSVDLKRLRKGLHRSKIFKGFDVTGIVLGSIIFLLVTTFMLGELLVPH